MVRLLVVVILHAAMLQACKESPTPPEALKDLRDYSWVSDTIQYPGSSQTWSLRAWGSNPENVYAVGHCSGSGPGTMHRFDGNSWRTTGFHAAEGGPIGGSVSLSDVQGFGERSIFFVGSITALQRDSGLVIEYDGTTWKRHYPPQNRPAFGFLTIGGRSRDDLWIGGGWRAPFVFHFNGSNWSRDSLPLAESSSAFIAVRSLAVNTSGEVWASVERWESGTGMSQWYLMRKLDGAWSIRDSVVIPSVRPPWGRLFWQGPDGEVYSSGNGIFRFRAGNWTKLADAPLFSASMSGPSASNCFVIGGEFMGTVGHYDGATTEYFPQLESSTFLYAGVWWGQNSVFVVGFDNSKTIIWRGN